MKMREMPYRVGEGAVEQAKLRAKMAVREVAHPTKSAPRRALRWILSGAVAMVAMVAVALIAWERSNDSYMEKFVAALESAPEELIYEQMADMVYYAESENSN